MNVSFELTAQSSCTKNPSCWFLALRSGFPESEVRPRGEVPADVAAIDEQRVAVEQLPDVVVQEADDAAGLEGMVAVPFQELREVVAERHALLDDELLGVAAADPQQPLEVLADDVGVLRLGLKR